MTRCATRDARCTRRAGSVPPTRATCRPSWSRPERGERAGEVSRYVLSRELEGFERDTKSFVACLRTRRWRDVGAGTIRRRRSNRSGKKEGGGGRGEEREGQRQRGRGWGRGQEQRPGKGEGGCVFLFVGLKPHALVLPFRPYKLLRHPRSWHIDRHALPSYDRMCKLCVIGPTVKLLSNDPGPLHRQAYNLSFGSSSRIIVSTLLRARLMEDSRATVTLALLRLAQRVVRRLRVRRRALTA